MCVRLFVLSFNCSSCCNNKRTNERKPCWLQTAVSKHNDYTHITTTRECVYLVTRGHFLSRYKMAATPFDPLYPKNPRYTQTSLLYVLWNRSYCRWKFYIAGIWIFDVLLLWPSYVKTFEKLSSDRPAEVIIPRRFAGAIKSTSRSGASRTVQ